MDIPHTLVFGRVDVAAQITRDRNYQKPTCGPLTPCATGALTHQQRGRAGFAFPRRG
jgi:hypothetical protein